jgi:hypothetical protein
MATPRKDPPAKTDAATAVKTAVHSPDPLPAASALNDTMVIDGQNVRINWTKSEGKTGMGEIFEAGISFNSTDHSVWRIRREPDGVFVPIRCMLYGRQNLTGEMQAAAARYTRKVGG